MQPSYTPALLDSPNRLTSAVQRMVAKRTPSQVAAAFHAMASANNGNGGQQPPAPSRPTAPVSENDPHRLIRAVERLCAQRYPGRTNR